MRKPTTVTPGDWGLRKEKMGKLPPLHVMSGSLYLASVHETQEKGEMEANANLFAASKKMYQAISVGLSGLNADGEPVSQEDAYKLLVAAKAAAEGKT